MPGISVEKLTLSIVISRFMRRATSVKRSIWKPSTPPPSLGMACGAKVPSTPVRSGGSLVWASAEPASNSAAARVKARRQCDIGSAPKFDFNVADIGAGILDWNFTQHGAAPHHAALRCRVIRRRTVHGAAVVPDD